MKKVLSIDGGGIRGLIPALVLAEIEERTKKKIGQCFDLIAGTSTGGILALGLSSKDDLGLPKYSAADLSNIYVSRGKDIFSRSFWKGISSVGGVSDELYSSKGLEEVLDEYFGDEPLGACLTNTLITAYDIQNREPVFLKSWKSDHRPVPMKFAARATSAAPTYFEPALVPIGGSIKALVDGGVFVNTPTVSAYAEAKKLWPEEKEFFVLSLGTGELNRTIPYRDAKGWGKVGWLNPLLGCMFDGMSDAAHYQMQMFLGSDYIRLQASLTYASDDMDNASNGNLENLKAEARMLLKTHADEIKSVCGRL